MPVILLLALLILTQMMVILLLELCTHRRPMVKTEWKDVQECPKEYLFNNLLLISCVSVLNLYLWQYDDD